MEVTRDLPSKPGVYLFKDKKGNVLYIGKAIDLKSRVKSYLVLGSKNLRIQKMISQIDDIKYILTQSDFEALLLEAVLIKKFQPKFNVRLKDDKHFLYIKITANDEFPKVTTSRRETDEKAIFFGPFPSAKKTREVLRILRRIYPFCSQSGVRKRACFYSHLGLCNPCPSNIIKVNGKEREKAKKRYRHNISQILRILRGESKKIIKELKKEMIRKASREKFEEAVMLRDRISKLEYVILPREKISGYLEDFNFVEKKWREQLDTLFALLKSNYGQKISYPRRIEGYDVSDIGGKYATGSMVVFIEGDEEKSEYRRFKIRFKKADDFQMLQEILKRRLAHPEWPLSQLILVDGGIPQVSAAVKIMKERNLEIPILGLVKKKEELVTPFITQKDKLRFKALKLPKNSPALTLLRRVRDEAHRFARNHHLKLRLKDLLS